MVIAAAVEKVEKTQFQEVSANVLNVVWLSITAVAIITMLVLLSNLIPRREY